MITSHEVFDSVGYVVKEAGVLVLTLEASSLFPIF